MFVAKKLGAQIPTHLMLLSSVSLTTVVWVIVTFVTRPTKDEKLRKFYELVRPFGPGWRRIREESGLKPSLDSLPHCLLGWMLGCVLVYSALFGAGSLLYGQIPQGVVFSVVFLASACALGWLLPKVLSGSENRASEGGDVTSE